MRSNIYPEKEHIKISQKTCIKRNCQFCKKNACYYVRSVDIIKTYNEVPSSERPCKNTYGKCYRKYLRDQFSAELTEIVDNEDLRKNISSKVKSHFKMLDYCRALHAEENAIINMARLGGMKNLSDSTLYTTTYPCNLCANKIAQVGIRQIVYFEPYPQKEAKNILETHRVKQIPFEGVTFNGYFRFVEVLR